MVYRWHADNYSASADYFLNGVRLMRRLQGEGYFADVDDRAGLEAFVCHLARTAAVKAVKAGRKDDAWRLYRREFARQARDGAVKFLLGFPVVAGLG